MAIKFVPDGLLDIDTDPTVLPVEVSDKTEVSRALTRCKNLSLDNTGLAKTRHGSRKLNQTALDEIAAHTLAESEGFRYLFSGKKIYKDEVEIESGLTSAKWRGLLYKADNAVNNSIFALNGTDRKRITGDDVEEWGIDPPENAPTLGSVDYSITYDWEADNLPVGATYRKFTNTLEDSSLFAQETVTISTNRWVAVGRFGDGSDKFAYSNDGIAWIGKGNPLGNLDQWAIAWNGSRWVTGGSTTNTLGYSDDGITWVGLGKSIITSDCNGIAWNGSLFVAIGGSAVDKVATSPDGINWTGRGSGPFSARGYGIAWNGSLFVAVGDGSTNTIATSPDGINWTGRGDSVLSIYGRGVAWNGSLWVAVGWGVSNTIAYSSDGITWTGLGKSIFTSAEGIAWNGSLFVAVGSGSNTIATSPDGITWTGLGTSIFSTRARDVAWNGSLFVAVGSGTNQRAYSSDGINWTGDPHATGRGLAVASAPAPELVPAVSSMSEQSLGTTLVPAEVEYIYPWEQYYENLDDVQDYLSIATASFYGTYYYETAVNTKAIRVKYTYARKDGNVLEAESNPSPAATTGDIPSSGITATWEISSDPQVTHVRVYRTLPGSFDFFFDGEHEVALLKKALTKEDTALGTEVATNHDRPPLGNVVYGPGFNGYCFLLQENKFYFCLAFRPEYWPIEYYIEVGPPQFDLTAVTFFNAATYVMNRNEIYLIQGTSFDSFFPFPLGGAETGAITQELLEVVKGMGIFRVHNDGIWLFDGNKDKRVTEERFSPIFQGETKGTIPAINIEYIENGWLFYHKTKLYFGYPGGTSIYPDNILVINIQTNKTVHYDYSQTYRAITADKTNDRVLAVDNAGFVWEIENHILEDDAGVAISWEVQSKSFSDALYKYFPRFAKYDIELGTGASATGNILLNDEIKQSHTINNRKTKKRLITGVTGDRIGIRITGSGVANIRQCEVE